jgi:hypothetical protein
MTPKQQQLLRRALIAAWELLHAENKTEAIKHVDEIVDAVSDLSKEDDK